MEKEEEKLEGTVIHGRKVKYDEQSGHGAYFLESLSREEAQVFFDGAYRSRTIPFEDRMRWNYTLTYVPDGGTFYYLIKKR